MGVLYQFAWWGYVPVHSNRDNNFVVTNVLSFCYGVLAPLIIIQGSSAAQKEAIAMFENSKVGIMVYKSCQFFKPYGTIATSALTNVLVTVKQKVENIRVAIFPVSNSVSPSFPVNNLDSPVIPELTQEREEESQAENLKRYSSLFKNGQNFSFHFVNTDQLPANHAEMPEVYC